MSFTSFFFANENNLIALVVFAILVVFVIINRKKFSVEAKVMFIYRTHLGLKIMKRFAKYKRIVNIYSVMGVFAAFVSIALMLYLLVPYFGQMISQPASTTPQLQLLLPVSGVPGVLGVPVIYWLIALVVVIVLHEASHGIVALSKRIKLKSSGFGFFLAFLPLAFVEPDEKRFAKASRGDRLKVLAAGSFTNILLGIAFLVIYFLLSNYIIGIHAVSSSLAMNTLGVLHGSLAYNAGLKPNTTITEINGNQFFSPSEAEYYLSATSGRYINLTDSSGNVYSIKQPSSVTFLSALYIVGVIKNGPAYNAGLKPNTTITEINGNQFFSPSEAEYYLSVTPGQYVNLTDSSGNVYTIKTTYNASITTKTHSYIGIEGGFVQSVSPLGLIDDFSQTSPSQFIIQPIAPTAYPNSGFGSQILYWFDGLFLWLFIISLGVGLANFLPIFYITDGCKIVNEFIGYFTPDQKLQERITNWVIIAFSVFFILLSPLGTLLFSNL
jgi:membrane-associated protease RseP (regulator of RpoE activity)